MENPFQIILDRLDNIEKLLHELNGRKSLSTKPDDSIPELMAVSQVAKYLSLSVQTVYGFTSRSEIPNFKRGKRLYFRKSEIDEWILQCRRKTIYELQKEAEEYISKRKR